MVLEKGKTIDMSDLEKDPVVYYQRKYYMPLALLISVVIPTLIPYYYWSESLANSYFICVAFRLAYTLNITFLVNSAAHMWGFKV